jgi:hypothetical protein
MRTRLCGVGTDELLRTVRLKKMALMRHQSLDGFQLLAGLG